MFRFQKTVFALAVATCTAAVAPAAFGQANENTPLDKDRRDPTNQNDPSARQPGGAAPAGQPAAMAQPAQVDQQLQQEMAKIRQSPQGALDKLFVLGAGVGGQFEVAYARQALQKSQDDQVKQLAQTIIQDHQKANQQLMQVAQAVGVTLPAGVDSMHAEKLQTLAALDAKDYDKKFVCMNNEAHAKAIEAYKTASATAMNPQLKQYASQTLPVLQQHHQAIMQVGQKMGVVVPGDAMPASGRLPAERPAADQPDQNRPATPGQNTTPGGTTPGGAKPQGVTPR